ncbi:diguanylate cyclase [Sphingomonas sp.]|uniref:sensor domain-containing diguanylate cyclase n=1 Tax=Sphingomonas sp. TaxID=28214 RepID=UPI000DB819A3|nr:diguanylate cyclase [Sphingomonas sp.]PZU06728.1 MAG: diguanylate cyclase [Sphingomonas sp.]
MEIWPNIALNRLTQAIPALAAFLLYATIAALTIHLTSDGRTHATVWPADAIILALLLVRPRGEWLSIILAGWAGNFVANGLTRGWTGGIILYGAVNMAQAVLAAAILRRWLPNVEPLADGKATVRFLSVAGLLAPAAGAILGSLASVLNYQEPFWPSFARWFGSNALGFLIATPFFHGIFSGGYAECYRQKSGWKRAETLGLLILHGAVTCTVFWQSSLPLLFVPFAALVMLAFRLGRLETITGVIIVAIVTAYATYKGSGPITLVHGDAVVRSIFFQAYLGMVLCTALPVSAVVASQSATLSELAEHRFALHQILANTPDGILSFDASSNCRWADGRLLSQLGIHPRDLMGRTVEDFARDVSGEAAALISAMLDSSASAATVEFEPKLRLGTVLEASVGVVGPAGSPSGAVVVLRDITVRKSREAAIVQQAETDDLTGVFNRKGFRTRFAQMIDHVDEHLTLALIDVDNFKTVNDRFGHAVGDAVLEEVARQLVAGTREADVVGRLGGDEFAILFRCEMTYALAACERIAATVRRSTFAAQGSLASPVSLSCGLAKHSPGMTRGELFETADKALYEVKQSGRDGVRAAA